MSNLDPLTDAKLVRGLIDLIYPVGSDVFNESAAFDPNQLYPNTTWERIRGVMPIGVNEDDADFSTAGKTGGSKSHTQTIDEVAQHAHKMPGVNEGAPMSVELGKYPTKIAQDTRENWNLSIFDESWTGGSKPMDIMNPYRTTYWWHRTK